MDVGGHGVLHVVCVCDASFIISSLQIRNRLHIISAYCYLANHIRYRWSGHCSYLFSSSICALSSSAPGGILVHVVVKPVCEWYFPIS